MTHRQTIRRLLGFLRPFWRGVIAAIFINILTVFAGVGLLATSAWLISRASVVTSIADLGIAPAAVRLFGISRGVFRYLERLIAHDITFRILARVRVWFYEHLEPLAPAGWVGQRSGDLLGQVVTDVDELQNFFLRAVSPPIVALLTAAAVVIFYGMFDWLLAVVIAVWLLLMLTALPLLAWWAHHNPGREIVAARSAAHAALVDAIQGIDDITAYCASDHTLSAINAHNDRLLHAEGHANRWDSLQTALSLLLVQGASISVLAFAVPRVDGIMLATLMLAITAAAEAITPLAESARYLSASLAAGERLFATADRPPVVVEASSLRSIDPPLTLTAHDVTFSYPESTTPALNAIAFDAPAGARIAVVGGSGGGKSTLVKLLARLHDPTHGRITLNGVSLTELPLAYVRRQIGVFSQRAHLFNTTIAENIRLGRRGASEADVIAAAQQAQIHDFVQSLPDGYATIVGERGTRLSGGQRQRIALARLVLQDAPIWVLDEPTANLDVITERAVLDAILQLAADRTLVLITHRLERLNTFDHILVLQDGALVEHGTHAALMLGGGIYHRLFIMQAGSVNTVGVSATSV